MPKQPFRRKTTLNTELSGAEEYYDCGVAKKESNNFRWNVDTPLCVPSWQPSVASFDEADAPLELEWKQLCAMQNQTSALLVCVLQATHQISLAEASIEDVWYECEAQLEPGQPLQARH